MSVVIETTLGDITVDLFIKERPRASINFLKLCKMKYYNFSLFHTISRGFIAQTGDPTGSRNGGESIHGVLDGPSKRYFEAEKNPRIKHTHNGLVSFVGNDENLIGSQFFITLGSELTYLDDKHCVFGEVMEGLDVLELLNETICDNDNRPYKDVRITHTVVLDDPFPDFKTIRAPSRSPSPSKERLQGGRIAADEDIDDTEGKSAKEISEMLEEREAKARATILEMVGDLPDAEMAPPENVLFVCKLNPVTSDDDLEIIFSRFGKINTCEVIRDRKTGDSLQYAFVEFAEQKSCEDAYFKMDNVLIDDRRIHVDFSQSVSKIKWNGKGRGVTTFDENGRKTNNERYKGDKNPTAVKKRFNQEDTKYKSNRNRSRSPANNKQKSYRNKSRSRSPNNKSKNRNASRSRSKSHTTPNGSRSPKAYRNRSKSPNNVRSYRDRSPKAFRNRSRSPNNSKAFRNRSRSPNNSKVYRNRSRSPNNSKVYRNRSRSPNNRGFRNGSPRAFQYRTNNNFKSFRNRSRSPRSSFRNRSRSPIAFRNRSPNNASKAFRNKSPQRRSRSPKASTNYSKSRDDKTNKNEKDNKNKAKNSRDSSSSSSQSSSSEDEKVKKKKNKKLKTKRADSSCDEKSKKLSKKSKKHASSEDDEDDSPPKKKKKSKHKKRSKSSSSEEEVKKKSKKKKKKKSD